MVTIAFGIMMTILITGYPALVYLSGRYVEYEAMTILFLAIISLFTNLMAMMKKPKYAKLMYKDNENQFLKFLK